MSDTHQTDKLTCRTFKLATIYHNKQQTTFFICYICWVCRGSNRENDEEENILRSPVKPEVEDGELNCESAAVLKPASCFWYSRLNVWWQLEPQRSPSGGRRDTTPGAAAPSVTSSCCTSRWRYVHWRQGKHNKGWTQQPNVTSQGEQLEWDIIVLQIKVSLRKIKEILK